VRPPYSDVTEAHYKRTPRYTVRSRCAVLRVRSEITDSLHSPNERYTLTRDSPTSGKYIRYHWL